MNRYSFNNEINDKLKGFKTYLQELGNGTETIRQKSNYAGYFLNWMETENLNPEETRYNDLLNFIDYCNLAGKSKKHINSKLRAIRNYYDYLKTTNPEIANPATNLYLKGVRQKLPSNIMGMERLEKLYQEYPSGDGQVPLTDTRTKRNRVILGLLVYQGVTTEELKQLEVSHVKLRKGKIYIPGNRRRNSRTLELKPCQVLELHEYLTEIRLQILNEVTAPKPARPACRPGRKPKLIDVAKLRNQLFISINGSENLKNSLLHMFRKIRKTNPDVLHAKQIRASVITHWLKNYNLREVQYFAGHKHVSSTERYQLNQLDNLQKRLEQFHPLNNQT